MKLIENFIKRYEKQIVLNEIKIEGQKKILKSKILCVGAGGLGTTVLPYLAASGVGTIGIVEYDKIELSNLHRQTIYNTYQLGLKKSTCVKELLKKINPNVNIIIFPYKLTHLNALKIVNNFEVIIDCTDNIKTKELLNKISVKLQIPLIYGSASYFTGQISVFNSNNTSPCYACLYQVSNNNNNKNLQNENCNEGVLGPVPGIIGCLQTIECIKILVNKNTHTLSGYLLTIDTLTMTTYKHQIKKKINCHICSKKKIKKNNIVLKKEKIHILNKFNCVKHFVKFFTIMYKKKNNKKETTKKIIEFKNLHNEKYIKKNLPISKKEIIFITCPNNVKSKIASNIFIENYKYKNVFVIQLKTKS